jgi:hypothetical protein
MNQRAIFYTASQCLRTTCPSCGNNWPPNRKSATRPGFLLINGLGRLFRVLVLALLTWLLAGVLTLLALCRILVLLVRLLVGVLTLLTAALVALLIVRLPSLSSPFAIISINKAPRVMPFLSQARPRAVPLEAG